MKLADLDRHPGGNFPLQLVVRWLDTLTRSPAVTWSPGQRAAAQEAVAEARELLATDVATLAGRASVARDNPPKTRAEVLAAIDRAEEETAAAIRAQEAATPAPQTVYADLDLRGQGVDLRNAAQALAGALPPGTDVRLSVERDEADDLEARAVANLGRRPSGRIRAAMAEWAGGPPEAPRRCPKCERFDCGGTCRP